MITIEEIQMNALMPKFKFWSAMAAQRSLVSERHTLPLKRPKKLPIQQFGDEAFVPGGKLQTLEGSFARPSVRYRIPIMDYCRAHWMMLFGAFRPTCPKMRLVLGKKQLSLKSKVNCKLPLCNDLTGINILMLNSHQNDFTFCLKKHKKENGK